MTSEWKWAGARWWKFDFHAHTPASDDYGHGPNQRQLKQYTYREWLLDFMRAGIDCVVITDHNSGLWVDPLKDELAKLESEQIPDFRPLHLFPGVEIGVTGGVHLLAIFDPNCSTSHVDKFLGAAGYKGKNGDKDACTSYSLVDVAREIVSYGGIAVPAHADKNNGCFIYTGPTLNQILDCSDIYAMELMDTTFSKSQQYIDKKTSWTEIIGSDSHHPDTVGRNSTWVKMGHPNLDGLRLALLDGSLSVKRSDMFGDDPNLHGHLAIESLSVKNARYIGRSKAFECYFNPWLNTVIGGRGTGKSTLLEFIRIVMRRESEIPESLEKDFEKYRTVYENRNDDGLLTENSTLCVTYRKDENVFKIQWSYDGNEEAILEVDDHGNSIPVFGDVQQRFPVRMYSQKQIFEMARRPQALLKIIDDAPEVKYREWLEKWKEEESRFLALRAKYREIQSGLSEESRLLGELDDIKKKLIVFEKAKYSKILRYYQNRLRQTRAIEAWKKSWNNTGSSIRELAEQLAPENLDKELFDSEDETDKQLLGHTETVSKSLKQIVAKLNSLAADADKIVSDWDQKKDESLWQTAVDNSIDAYKILREQLQKEKIGDPREYGKFVQDRQALEERLKNLTSRRKTLDELEKQAEESLDELTSLRRDITQRRSKFLKNILSTNMYVSMSILPYGSADTAEDGFRSVLQLGEGRYEKDVGSVGRGGIIGGLYAGYPNNNERDQSLIKKKIGEFEEKLRKQKNRIKEITKGNTSDQDIKDRRFVIFLGNLPPETLDRMDCWHPEDSLDVRYSTKPGGEFRPVQQGSPGQKTAALLAFLLSYGDEPLILDQPEDDLDNQLIYDLIVTQLRTIKQDRQVIVVTHNANIVVNGDSELVVTLDVGNGETQKVSEGSLQENLVREDICNVMEGGTEAFDLRYRRIKAGGKYV
ncbi:MAG: AAA family ATPase [Smithellaceae bacterium]|nr:AAA family ATPase [Smithellaceae bacterium]